MAHAPVTDFTRYLYESKFGVKDGEKGNVQFMCGGSRPFLLPDKHYPHAVDRYLISVQNRQPNYIVEVLQGHVVKAFQDLDDRVILRATQDVVTGDIKAWPADHAAAVVRAKAIAHLYHTEVLQQYYPDRTNLDMIVQGADLQFLEKLDKNKQRIRQALLDAEVDRDLVSLSHFQPAGAQSSSLVQQQHVETQASCAHAEQRCQWELPFNAEDFDLYSDVGLPPPDDTRDAPVPADWGQSYFCCEECGRHPTPLANGQEDEKCLVSTDEPAGPWFWALFKMGWHYTCPGVAVTTAMLLQLRASFIVKWREHPVLGGRRSVLLQDYDTVVDRSVIVNLTLRWPGSLKAKKCDCLGTGPKRGGKGKRGPKEDCVTCCGAGFVSGGRPYWPLFKLDSHGKVEDIQQKTVDAAMLRACMVRLVPEGAPRHMQIPNGAPRAVPPTEDELEQRRRKGNKPVPVIFSHDAVGMKTWPKDEILVDTPQWLAIRELIRERVWPQYKGLEIRKAHIESRNQNFICVSVDGTNCNLCMNKGGDHPSCTIWFLLRRATKQIHQKCFCRCPAGPAKPRLTTARCADYESPPMPIPSALFPRIFPTQKEKYCDLWTGNPTLIAPEHFPGATVATRETPALDDDDDDVCEETCQQDDEAGRKRAKSSLSVSGSLSVAVTKPRVMVSTPKEMVTKMLEAATIAQFNKHAGSLALTSMLGVQPSPGPDTGSALGNYTGRKGYAGTHSTKRKRTPWGAAPPSSRRGSSTALANSKKPREDRGTVLKPSSAFSSGVFEWIPRVKGKMPPAGFGDAAPRAQVAATPMTPPLSTGCKKQSRKSRARRAQPKRPRD